MSLPFILLDDLQEIVDNLMDNLDESIINFATYIELTYSHGQPTRNRRQVVPPKFTPEM